MITMKMKCYYRQEWPNLTRVYLEPASNIRVNGEPIYTDRGHSSTKFEIEHLPTDDVHINIDDFVMVTIEDIVEGVVE